MRRQTVHLSATLAALLAAGLIGCSTANEYKPGASPTQLAAYAASLTYPVNAQAQDDLHLVAIVNHQNGQITLHNFSSTPLSDFNLWVNQTYVLHISQIDPNGSETFNLTDFYNSAGISLESATAESIRKVQVQAKDGVLYNAQGPHVM